MVECTALEMRHTREGIVGSNPTLSAIALCKTMFCMDYFDTFEIPRNSQAPPGVGLG